MWPFQILATDMSPKATPCFYSAYRVDERTKLAQAKWWRTANALYLNLTCPMFRIWSIRWMSSQILNTIVHIICREVYLEIFSNFIQGVNSTQGQDVFCKVTQGYWIKVLRYQSYNHFIVLRFMFKPKCWSVWKTKSAVYIESSTLCPDIGRDFFLFFKRF